MFSSLRFIRRVVGDNLTGLPHGLIDDFREWRYSLYGALVSDKATRLSREDVLALYGNRAEFVEVHAEPVNEKVIETLIENDFV